MWTVTLTSHTSSGGPRHTPAWTHRAGARPPRLGPGGDSAGREPLCGQAGPPRCTGMMPPPAFIPGSRPAVGGQGRSPRPLRSAEPATQLAATFKPQKRRRATGPGTPFLEQSWIGVGGSLLSPLLCVFAEPRQAPDLMACSCPHCNLPGKAKQGRSRAEQGTRLEPPLCPQGLLATGPPALVRVRSVRGPRGALNQKHGQGHFWGHLEVGKQGP